MKPVDSWAKTAENISLDSLMEIFPEACIVINDDWYIVNMNNHAESLFLYPKEYLTSKPFWEIAPQYLNTPFYNALHKVKGDKKMVYVEFTGVTSGRYFGATIDRINDYCIVFFRDISAFRYTQIELVKAEERFAAAFRKNPAIMTIVSLDTGRYITVNDAFTKYTGYSINEVVGKTKEELDLVCSSIPGDSEIQFVKNIPLREVTMAYKTKSKECREALLSSEIIEINGRPCLLGVAIDVTDSVTYKKEIINMERLKLVGQMAAGIAHEIRNPLQTVRGFLQLLSAKEEISQYSPQFTLMINELDRANQIITDYLALSRDKATEFTTGNLNQIIKKILPLMQIQAVKEDKTIAVELNNIPQVLLNESEIIQLLLNLARNALEATGTKGIITITTKADSDWLVLSVSDQGQGIPVDVQDQIGMPFFSTKANGTGLGLPMCYSIAERHNAKLNFISNENGTTFYLRFPLNCRERS